MTQGMMADVNPALENIAAALRSIATAITVGQIGQDVDDDPVAAMAGKAKRTPAFSSGIGERNQMIRDLLLMLSAHVGAKELSAHESTIMRTAKMMVGMPPE